MGLFKADFYRFFTIGFAVGALLIGMTMEGDVGSQIASGMVPSAEAQAAQ